MASERSAATPTARQDSTEDLAVPLYVDLDGTLVRTDLLWESVLLALKHRPPALLMAVGELVRGRARFKRAVAASGWPSVEQLPYNPEVLAMVEEARSAGRRVVLATAADRSIAEAVAGHVGSFAGVLASDGTRNLKGRVKLAAIREDASGPFDYVGDSSADAPLFEAARRSVRIAPPPGRSRTAWRLLRPHQWAKNLLVFVPALTSHSLGDPSVMRAAMLAFVAFCLAASGTYAVNDLLDLEADRAHPRKRNRPLASGALPPATGLMLGLGLLALSLTVAALALPTGFTALLLGYVVVTQAYSLKLKRLAVVDVLTLAGLYATRVLAGALAAQVALSPWLLAFSGFLFLSLAFAKRYGELELWRGLGRDRSRGRDYGQEDAALILSFGATSGYLSVLVLALYVHSDAVHSLYRRPAVLWLLAPLVLYWLTRIWLLVQRGRLGDDPLVFALRDRTSYAIAAAMLAAVLAARPL